MIETLEENEPMTPYQAHEKLGHKPTRYSPDGMDIIEECECGARFLFPALSDRPISLHNLATSLYLVEQAKSKE